MTLMIRLFPFLCLLCGVVSVIEDLELADKAVDIYNRLGSSAAIEYLDSVLETNPDCADCYYVYSVIEGNDSKFESAALRAKKAINLEPFQADYYRTHGLAVLQLKISSVEDAAVSLFKSLRLKPDQPDIIELLQRVKVSHPKVSSLEKRSFEDLFNSSDPRFFEFRAFSTANESEKCENFTKAIQMASEFWGPEDLWKDRVKHRVGTWHSTIAVILDRDGNHEAAIPHYETSVRLLPIGKQLILSHLYLVQIYTQFVDYGFDDAMENLERAYQLTEDYNINLGDTAFLLPFMKGVFLMERREKKEALEFFEAALELDPNCVPCLSNLAAMAGDLGDHDAALAYRRRGYEISPNSVAMAVNYALGLDLLDIVDESREVFERAMTLPGCDAKWRLIISLQLRQQERNLLNYRDHRARAYEMRSALLSELSRASPSIRKADASFLLLTEVEISLEEQFLIAKEVGSDVMKMARSLSYDVTAQSPSDGVLRVGFLSFDFTLRHPVGILLKGIMPELRKSRRLELYCYDLKPLKDRPDESFGDDAVYEETKESCHVYKHVGELDDHELGDLLVNDELHIAADLTGYTLGSSPEVFAVRIAPVQFQYLGYLGTMGFSAMDYILMDRIVNPPEIAKFNVEDALYTPYSFLPGPHAQLFSNVTEILMKPGLRETLRAQFNFPPTVPALKYQHSTFGAPRGRVLFLATHTISKVDPLTFEAWMGIMTSAPDSAIIMSCNGCDAEENLLSNFAEYGISSDRLVRTSKLYREQFLDMMTCTDVMLDVPSRSAGSTAIDGTWAGLPLVTLPGAKMTNRMGASVNIALGVTDAITHSWKEYQDLSISLVNHPEHLESLRAKTSQRVESQLFDTLSFARGFEDVLVEAWEKKMGPLPR